MQKARRNILGAALVAGTIGLGGADAQAAVRSGVWIGDGVALTLDDQGGRLDFDCGYATLPSPVTPDSKGRFSAVSAYYPGQPGPVDADRPVARVSARIQGTFTGDGLRLSFRPAGGAAETFDLTPGRRRKFVRCM